MRDGEISGAVERPPRFQFPESSLAANVNGTSQAWTFDPAAAFSAELKGSFDGTECDPPMWSRKGHCYKLHCTVMLSVAS